MTAGDPSLGGGPGVVPPEGGICQGNSGTGKKKNRRLGLVIDDYLLLGCGVQCKREVISLQAVSREEVPVGPVGPAGCCRVLYWWWL